MKKIYTNTKKKKAGMAYLTLNFRAKKYYQ